GAAGAASHRLLPQEAASLLDQTHDLLNTLVLDAEQRLLSHPPQVDRSTPLVAALEHGLDAKGQQELAALVAFATDRRISVEPLLAIARAQTGSPRARVAAAS